MNKLFAIAMGILALTSTVNAANLNLQSVCAQETWFVSGRSFKSFEDAMNKVKIPEGYVMAGVKYGKNGSEYVVIVKIVKG